MSVDPGGLTGYGVALSLTLRTCPQTHADWQDLVYSWIDLQRNGRSLIRLHWVVEMQRRGVPHLHVAAWYADPAVWQGVDDGKAGNGGRQIFDWLRLAAQYGADQRGQGSRQISGPLAWFRYVSKHASRTAAHYQREGKPKGWHATGRLWGRRGDWPIVEPETISAESPAWWKARRLIRAWFLADCRRRYHAGQGLRSDYLAACRWGRGMLRCNDPARSRAQGISVWIPVDVTLRLFNCVGLQPGSES